MLDLSPQIKRLSAPQHLRPFQAECTGRRPYQLLAASAATLRFAEQRNAVPSLGRPRHAPRTGRPHVTRNGGEIHARGRRQAAPADIFGLDQAATLAKAKEAHKRLALTYHLTNFPTSRTKSAHSRNGGCRKPISPGRSGGRTDGRADVPKSSSVPRGDGSRSRKCWMQEHAALLAWRDRTLAAVRAEIQERS
jgi:hypothetical protein